MSASDTVVVYGGCGALGRACVDHFKKLPSCSVVSIDIRPNETADTNIVLDLESTWQEQADAICAKLQDNVGDGKIKGIFCVAGGWAGGNAASADIIKNTELMYKQSVWSSVIAAQISAKFLAPSGTLVLTGAKPALEGTAGMIGYGMAKAAVHQLVKSLAQNDSGLPEGAKVAAILPITLDTPMNRKWMSDADMTAWTPLSFVASLFEKWMTGAQDVASGSLVKLITVDGETSLEVC